MKNRFVFPFGSFQAKLLAYLLVVGSIPLVCAMLVLYNLSSNYGEKELTGYLRQTHEQMLSGLRQAVSELDHMVKNTVNDYAVQRLLESRAMREPEERGIKEYVDFMLRNQRSQLKFIEEMCISFDQSGNAVCAQDNDVPSLDLMPLGMTALMRNERLIEPLDELEREDGSPRLRYMAPLYEIRTGIVRGTVTLVIRLDALLVDTQGRQQLINHLIYDSRGNLLYQLKPQTSDDAFYPDSTSYKENTFMRGNSIISQQKIGIEGVQWMSRIEVENQLPNSTFRSFKSTFFIFFSLLVLLSFISALLFSRMVTSPLYELRRLMKRAELGDLKAYWIAKGPEDMNDLGISYNQMLNRVEELIKQVKREESLKKEAEIEALTYQLNPHFLYNTLNTIKWVAKLHKTPQISEAVSALVRLLQASLGKKGDFLTVREELELIKDYMEIQRFRYGDKVRLDVELDPIASVCLVPRMILQPIVENAIIHGIEPSGRSGIITIRAWIERDLLFCQVEDNGVGVTDKGASLAEGTSASDGKGLKERMSGIGLSHIREKIKLYYGSDSKMYIYGKEREGTIVRLQLPVHQSEG
jgi:sensor histidine kinase YesM